MECFGSIAGCASLLDEGCTGLECSGSRAGCASLLDVGALSFGGCGKAGVDCVIGMFSSTGVAVGVGGAGLIWSEVANGVAAAGFKENEV